MRILATGLQYPEGPIAMPDGLALVVEIARETLTRIDASGKVEVAAHVPGGPNGAALGSDGKVFICNNGGLRFFAEGGTLRSNGQSESYQGGSIDVVDLCTGRVDLLIGVGS